MAIISPQKGLEIDKKPGKSNFELQPCQSDQGPQCLV